MENIFNFTARFIYWIICTAFFFVCIGVADSILMQVLAGMDPHEVFLSGFLYDNHFYPRLAISAILALGPSTPDPK